MEDAVREMQRRAIERHRRIHNREVEKQEKQIIDRYIANVEAFAAQAAERAS